MDVRAAIRRTRLPFVASLLLATLLGAPTAVERAPAARTAIVSAAPAGTVTAVPAASGRSAPGTAGSTPLPAAPAAVPAPPPALTDQAHRAPSAPRGPPAV